MSERHFVRGIKTVRPDGSIECNQIERFAFDRPATEPELSLQHQAKCAYCGRYGMLGSCEGCGAPNVPVTRIEVTSMRDRARRFIEVTR